MRCKCQICKTVLDSKTAHKITDKNGKNKYYCSKVEYQIEELKKRREKEDRDRVYGLLCNIFGYKIQNTMLFKEWKEWQLLKSNSEIADYLTVNEVYLTDAVAKLSSTEYAKIRYVSTILKNNLHDYIAENNAPIVHTNVDMEMFDSSHPVINKRRALADLEDGI